MLTKSEIAKLNAAREVLGSVRNRLELDSDGFLHGRLSEACNLSDLALLATVNLAGTIAMVEEMSGSPRRRSR